MTRIVFALAPFALFLMPQTATASDAAVGVAVSSYSAQVQGDYDLDRRVGLQAGVGEVLFLDDLSFSAGGRFYFVPRKVSPYVGVLYRTFEERWRDRYGAEHEGFRASLFGPTVGLRAREWRGVGAFGQIELLQHVGPRDDEAYDPDHHGDEHHWHTSLAVGVQWWF